MHQDNVKHQPFYKKWQKASYMGLTALSKWDKVAKIFQLPYLRDYIVLMNECPQVQERYELGWDYFDNTVKYKELALPDTEDVIHDINKLNALQRKMQQMTFKFDSCMQQYNSRLSDTDARLTSCEATITEQLNRATSKFATSATKHYNSLTEFASTTFAKFQSNHRPNHTENVPDDILQLCVVDEWLVVPLYVDRSNYESQSCRVCCYETTGCWTRLSYM